VPSKRLTEEGVRKLKPPQNGKQIDYFDIGMAGRLVLRVNYGGRKTWRALYYVKGVNKKTGKPRTEPRTHPLGLYPILNLKQAREKARQFLADPQKALSKAGSGSFKEVAENFVKRHVEANKLRSQPEIQRCLKKYVYPAWEHRPFPELTRNDVTQLLDELEDNHGKRQADMVLAIVRKMMNWHATRTDYVPPIVKGMGRYKSKERRRKRWLNDDEIRALWKGCDGMGTFGAIVKVLLLTAQREGKVTSMRWADLKDGVWTMPAEDREKGTGSVLKLTPMALDIIEAQPRLAGNPYVFAVSNGKGVFNSFSQRKDELDEKLPKMPPWVIHDLRRTSRKLMTRAGVRPDVAELALGHSIKGIQAVYDDAVECGPMINHALQCVSNEIEKILNPPPANVVAMQRRKKAR
jgi:integrase